MASEGLEGALSRLAGTGVYVTFDEFKGRGEAVRGSQRFAFAEKDFDNPRLSPHFQVRSGGTRSPGTSVNVCLPFITDLAANTALALQAHGLSQSDHAIWLTAGFTPTLIYTKLGRPPLTWFYPMKPLPLRLHAGARYLATMGRVTAIPVPVPAFLDLNDPEGMARWVSDRLGEGKRVCVTTYASSAVRVCAAAKESGLSLDGAWFITLGEPYTEAKRQIVESAGARALVRYAFTEAGIIGYGCAAPQVPDDMHFLSNCHAVIQRPRTVGDSEPSVDAFLFTSLLGSAPKVLLNVESGDYGIIERKACGCALGSAGLTTHLSMVRSFEKLSSEGMTFVRTELLRLLEEVLPSRFGGTASDYQVLEEERDGILRLLLLVSPGVGPVDEVAVRKTFLDGLGQGGDFERLGAGIWERAGTVEVTRRQPVATKAGKILPFHLLKV